MKLSTTELSKINDLIYYEGPFLSHFKDDLGNHYLLKWSDVNYEELYNIWLVFKVSNDNLRLFFDKQLSLLNLIELSDNIQSVNINDDIEVIKEETLEFKDINEDYLPSSESYYKENQYEQPYSNNLKQELNESK